MSERESIYNQGNVVSFDEFRRFKFFRADKPFVSDYS